MTFCYKLDPRTKFLMIFSISTLALLFNDLVSLTFLFGVTILVCLIMGVDILHIVFRLKRLIGLVVILVFVQSIFTQTGKTILTIFDRVIIRDEGLIKAFIYFIRISIIVTSAAILSTSTSRELIQGLIQLKIPYEIAFMVSVSIRFLPLLRNELADMIIAVQLRGVNLNKIKMKQKLSLYRYMLLPVLIGSLLKARELSNAMEMRGFRACTTRSSYLLLKLHPFDWVVMALSVAFFGIFMIWRI
ncbi:MAG: energy-coupling factor transporter transmembrane protein EcfT [Vallitaleaceae bacterium]|nr:energy-coupling factor transporter transmembrane protein EcfT [Vallitaleaceae bacterium]